MAANNNDGQQQQQQQHKHRVEIPRLYKDMLAWWLEEPYPVFVGGYQLGETIGKGSYAIVRVGVHLLTQQRVAIKSMKKMYAPLIRREVEVWRHLRHPNIIQLFEVVVTEQRVHLVMEYAGGGELFGLMLGSTVREREVRSLFRQLVQAIAYCHSRGYVHRDLKPENLLLSQQRQLKVADFGFAGEFTPGRPLDVYCGSVPYTSPEVLLGNPYDGPAADVWSMGVILFALLNGRLPFDDDNAGPNDEPDENTIRAKINSVQYRLNDGISPAAADLIARILRRSPVDRPTTDEILAHEWMNEGPVSPVNTPQPPGPAPRSPTSARAPCADMDDAASHTSEASSIPASSSSAASSSTPSPPNGPASHAAAAAAAAHAATAAAARLSPRAAPMSPTAFAPELMTTLGTLGINLHQLQASLDECRCDSLTATYFLLQRSMARKAAAAANATGSSATPLISTPHPAAVPTGAAIPLPSHRQVRPGRSNRNALLQRDNSGPGTLSGLIEEDASEACAPAAAAAPAATDNGAAAATTAVLPLQPPPAVPHLGRTGRALSSNAAFRTILEEDPAELQAASTYDSSGHSESPSPDATLRHRRIQHARQISLATAGGLDGVGTSITPPPLVAGPSNRRSLEASGSNVILPRSGTEGALASSTSALAGPMLSPASHTVGIANGPASSSNGDAAAPSYAEQASHDTAPPPPPPHPITPRSRREANRSLSMDDMPKPGSVGNTAAEAADAEAGAVSDLFSPDLGTVTADTAPSSSETLRTLTASSGMIATITMIGPTAAATSTPAVTAVDQPSSETIRRRSDSDGSSSGLMAILQKFGRGRTRSSNGDGPSPTPPPPPLKATGSTLSSPALGVPTSTTTTPSPGGPSHTRAESSSGPPSSDVRRRLFSAGPSDLAPPPSDATGGRPVSPNTSPTRTRHASPTLRRHLLASKAGRSPDPARWSPPHGAVGAQPGSAAAAAASSTAAAAASAGTVAAAAASAAPPASNVASALNDFDDVGRPSFDEPGPPPPVQPSTTALAAAASGAASSSAEVAATAAAASTARAPRIRTGIFNVKTTSTKDLPEIVRELLRVLTDNGVPFERRDDYHFVIAPGLNRAGPQLQRASATATTPTSSTTRLAAILAEPAPAHLHVRMELEICRVFGLGMHGIRLRRLAGDTWAYQALCNALLEQLHL